MKNKLLSMSFLNFFLTVTMLLAFASKASADQLDGAQTFYTVNLYATDYFGDLIPDPTTASGYAYNEVDLTINITNTIPTQFILPTVLSDASGCNWCLDSVPWSLQLTTGNNFVSYNGSITEDFFVNTPQPYHSMIIIYDTVAAGTVTMRVTSPGAQENGSDSTAYTVTVNIVDNSPPPKTKK